MSKVYIDRTEHEIALKGAEYYRNFMPYWVKLGLGLSLASLAFCLIFRFLTASFYLFIIFAIFAFVYAHIRNKHPNPREMTRAMIEASEKRLSKPNYVTYLLKHGFDVPERYLHKREAP